MLAAAAGAALFALLDVVLDLHPRRRRRGHERHVGRVDPASRRSRTSPVRSRRRPCRQALAARARGGARRDLALLVLVVAMAIAGSAGVPELLLACGAGAVRGCRRARRVRSAEPAARAGRRRRGAWATPGSTSGRSTLERAEGGRSQLYRATTDDGGTRSSRCTRRTAATPTSCTAATARCCSVARTTTGPSLSLEHDVEHEALDAAHGRANGGVACPRSRSLTDARRRLDGARDGATSTGRRSTSSIRDEIDDALLDAVWREVAALHRARASRTASCAPSNILVADGVPTIIDMDFAKESASPRLQAIDRAELLTSLAAIVGAEPRASRRPRACSAPDDLASGRAVPPTARAVGARRGSRRRRRCSSELRADIAAVTGEEPPPLERLIRVRPRTLLMITVGVGAFYLLLPQLADVGDSFTALRSRELLVARGLRRHVVADLRRRRRSDWPAVCRATCRSSPTSARQVASSFVNRVTPANVGGMALNVRFMQKVGRRARRGGDRHGPQRRSRAASCTRCCWSCSSRGPASRSSGFKIPASSKLLVIIAVVLAIVGVVVATRWGRRLIRTHVRALLQAVVDEPGGAGALAAEARDAVRRLRRRDARLHRGARRGGRRVRRRRLLRAGRRGLPRCVARRRGRTDARWPRCDGSRARRRTHRRRHGAGSPRSRRYSATGSRPTGCRSCPAGSASSILERRNFI